MKVALLDLNLLTALLWPTHEHHEAAHRWFQGRTRGRWATCALTQLGFVRLVSNPAFSRDALSPVRGLALLAANLTHPRHEFWTEAPAVPEAIAGMEARLQGYRQLTDAYLLTLAARRGGTLATFDGGLGSLAPAALETALEVVPTRGATA